MKALVFNGPRDIRYESFADPELKTANSAILKISKCSICGSDLHMYHGDNIGNAAYTSETPHFCIGHEFIGEVVETGKDVHNFTVGQKVLSAGGTGCGNCPHCLIGKPLQCRKSTAFGLSPELNGGQAEYVCIPNADTTLLATEDSMSDEHALLLTDAMTTAYFGITRSEVKPGGTVAIVGLGPIGLIGVELAFILGASRVFAIDPVASRRDMAAKLGAIALDPRGDAIAKVMEHTKGAGAQSVFEASDRVRHRQSLRVYRWPQGTAPFPLSAYRSPTIRFRCRSSCSRTSRSGAVSAKCRRLGRIWCRSSSKAELKHPICSLTHSNWQKARKPTVYSTAVMMALSRSRLKWIE